MKCFKTALAVIGFCVLTMGLCNAAEVASSYTSLHFQGVGAFYNYMPDQENVRFPLYLDQQYNLFRIYVPPGVRQVSVELYVPRDASIATVAHFGTPPESTTSSKAYNTISPVIVPTLEELQTEERFCSNFGGHITVVSASTRSFLTSDPKNRWLYVKLLRYGIGSVGLTQVAVDVNVAELKAWYASNPDWNYIEDVDTPPNNQTQTISGKVTNIGGTGISDITMTLSTGGTVTTAADGGYMLSVASGWSGSLTPSKSGYIFNPSSRPYTNVTSAQSDQNYVAARPGDVNGDDRVDLTDATLVLKILAGLSVGNTSVYADVNGDKKIGIEELEYILQVVAGLKP
jgi:hypothetical protein